MTFDTFLPVMFTPNLFVLFGLLLLLGLVAGELTHRTSYIPRITGFMLVGLFIGPSGLNVLTPELLARTRIFLDMSLALILFDLGRNFHLRELKPPSRLAYTAIFEALLSFGLITGGLTLLGFPLLPAALAGAIGVSSSPAIVLMVMREFGAKGPVTAKALNLLAANNIFSFVLYTLLLIGLHLDGSNGWLPAALQPLYQLVGSVAVAAVLTMLAGLIMRLGLSHTTGQFALIIALLMLGLGMADILRVSPLLTGLVFGVMVANFSHTRALRDETLGGGAEMFFIILFVIAGAKLKLLSLAAVWPFALAFVVLRGMGKLAGVYLANWHNPALNLRQQTALAATLQPMAGMAIGLITSIGVLYPELGIDLVVVVLAAVAMLETIGPLVTEWALKHAREIDPEQSLKH
ncbi:MAG: cation:proton antiporter [Pseudomonadaceae bacterium]|nr:cation:proton antiporter [Pseudomonadaceae bacterium]